MSNTNPVVTPTLFKYFLGQFTDAIRIEWTANQVTHSAELNAAGVVTHASAEVPADLVLRARYCLEVGLDRGVEGCEYMGVETAEQMFAAIAHRCCSCGKVQPSLDWLSNAGECGVCFVVQMSVAS